MRGPIITLGVVILLSAMGIAYSTILSCSHPGEDLVWMRRTRFNSKEMSPLGEYVLWGAGCVRWTTTKDVYERVRVGRLYWYKANVRTGVILAIKEDNSI